MEIQTTDEYDKWFRRLKDHRARARILVTLRRAGHEGHLVGDIKPVGGQVHEMRFHIGPGYRIYYLRHHDALVLLLIGGDKSTQSADIAKAQALAAKVRKERP